MSTKLIGNKNIILTIELSDVELKEHLKNTMNFDSKILTTKSLTEVGHFKAFKIVSYYNNKKSKVELLEGDIALIPLAGSTKNVDYPKITFKDVEYTFISEDHIFGVIKNEE